MQITEPDCGIFHGDAPGNAAVRPGKGLHQTAKGGLPGRGFVPAFFMKRTLIFGLLLALLLTGCAEKTRTDTRTDSRADSQWTWHRAGQGDIFARSDTGYYFFLDGYLHYMDEKTMTPVVVCGKPNCMHMQETDREKQRECHAYFTLWSGWGPTVYWQNGTVYVLSRGNVEGERAVLWQLSEDASTRTRLLTVPGAFDTQASGDSAALHRGCFYIAMTQFDEKGNAFHEIRRYDLSHPEAEPELLYESADQSINSLSDVRIRDNCLIFREDRTEGERALLQLRLDGDGAVQPYDAKLPEPLAELGGLAEDGRYYYRLASASSDESGKSLYVYGADGTELLETPLAEAAPGVRGLYVSPGKHVFLYGFGADGGQVRFYVWYFEKDGIETGKLTLTCL